MDKQTRGPYRKSYLVPHGRGWKYVRAVPKHLQKIEGKLAWRACFGTISRAEAEVEAHKLAAQHGERILRLNGMTSEEREVLVHARANASFSEMLATIVYPETLRVPQKGDDEKTAKNVRKRADGARRAVVDLQKQAQELRQIADRAEEQGAHLIAGCRSDSRAVTSQ